MITYLSQLYKYDELPHITFTQQINRKFPLFNAENQNKQIKRYYDDFKNDKRKKVLFFLNKFKIDISADYNDNETFGKDAEEIKAII